MFSTIVLQHGPIGVVGVNGDQIDEVIAYCRDRLIEFNRPPHVNRPTTEAIEHLDVALLLLDERTADRVSRGVEGTNQP
jgi:hypothetical protein